MWTRPFILAFAASFFGGLSWASFFHLPGFLTGLGADELAIGWVMGVMSAAAIAVRPVLGRVTDRYGRRPVLLFGAIVNVVACACYLTVSSIGPWAYAVRILHGLGEAAMFSVTFTIAGDLSPPGRRAEAIAIFGISGMIPMAVAGGLGDVIVTFAGYRELFVSATGFGVLALLCALAIGESRPADDGADGDAGARHSFTEMVVERSLAPVWLVGFGFAVGVSSYFTFIKTMVESQHLGGVWVFFTPYVVLAVGVRVFFAWVPDRFGLERTLYPALAATMLGLLLLSATESPLLLATAGAVCGIGHGYAFPIMAAMATARSAASRRGTAMAIYTALFDLGVMIGSPLFGAILRNRPYGTMFRWATLAVFSATLLFAVVDRLSRSHLLRRPAI